MRGFLGIVLMLIVAVPSAAQQVPQSSTQIQFSFAPVVRQTAPAVVNIYARIIREERRSPLEDDPFFERFFQGFGSERPQVQNSLGSGVILSSDGIVVSNNHVVGNASDIRVVLADRREFEAEVLLGDAENDLAILRLKDASQLPFLALRPSREVEVGDLVLAIGNPFGVGQTVSSGIVSGLARSGTASGGGRGYFIQTDAPINPGNSGGALVGISGRLIGINTSILTRSGGSNGVGFAIPADLVATFVAQAQAGRTKFATPWAGVSGQAVDADMAGALGLERPGGIVIAGLHPLSPFARSGLVVGDVVVDVDGQPVNTAPEVIYRMSVAGFDTDIRVGYTRDGKEMSAVVAMIEAPEEPPREERVLRRGSLLEGMRLARINPAVLSEYDLPIEARGIVVVDPERLGRRVGLRRGDVIEAINDQDVRHPDDIARILATPASRYILTVLRGRQRIFLQFRV